MNFRSGSAPTLSFTVNGQKVTTNAALSTKFALREPGRVNIRVEVEGQIPAASRWPRR
jgi:hypothetical protein